jgi:hypothetical protein
VSAAPEAITDADNVTLLIKEARDRQRRRRRVIGVALALSLIAAVVVAVGRRGSTPPPGSPLGVSATAGASSSTSRRARTLTARDFVKYGISCQMLRQAAIPIGPGLGWYCAPRFSARDWDGIVFGMSKQQVRRLVGRPAASRDRCWRYPVYPTRYEIATGVAKRTLDVCFFAGRVSDMSYQ